MEFVWNSQSPQILKENMDNIILKYKIQLNNEDVERSKYSSSIPHYFSLIEEEPHKYLNINLPLSIQSIIMQIRLNYDRITVHNNSITLNAWFKNDEKCGTCLKCDYLALEDINHFIFECKFYEKIRNNFNIIYEDFVNADFYRGLTYTQGSNIYNYIQSIFNLRYEEID